MEKFLERIREERNVSYGDEVDELVEQGAVEELILTTEKYREKPGLAEKTEQMGGSVSVVHTDHEAGKRLENFGGKAALLRYDPR